MVRTHHHPDEVEVVDPLRLRDREIDIGKGDEPCRRQAGRVVRAVARDPVVVRTAGRRRLVSSQRREIRHEQTDRRIEDDSVDALGIHGSHVGRGVEAVRELVRHEVEVAARHERGVDRQVGRHRIVGPRCEHFSGLDHVRIRIEHAKAGDGHVTSSHRHIRRAAPC